MLTKKYVVWREPSDGYGLIYRPNNTIQ